MKKFNKSLLIASLACVLVAGCTTPRTLSYIQDMAYGTAYDAQKIPDMKLQPGDRLDIKVTCDNPQLAAPFNAISAISSDGASDPQPLTYEIDPDGFIDFPILGRLSVEGKTINEVRDMISDRIVRSGYIREPAVNVQLGQYFVTVIGNVGNQNIDVDRGPINIFQVIAEAGGTTANVNIKDVMVVRTQNGERIAYSVNLKSRSVFDSPVFYLRQNDIVYFKPKGFVISQEAQTVFSFTSWIFSFISMVSSISILVMTQFSK